MTNEIKPVVSIVVPMFNAATTIERAVASVFAQDHPRWELLVVNDCSTDDSVHRVRTMADDMGDGRVQVIELPQNGGSSAARNAGIDAATGDFLAFLDADDELLPTYLSTLTAACDLDTDIVVGGHYLSLQGQQDRIRSSTTIGRFDGPTALRHGLSDRITPFPWDKLYRRTLFSTVRYPHGLKRFEDMMVNLTLYSRAREVVVLDQPIYRYHITSGSLTWGRVTSTDDARHALAYLDQHLDPMFRGGEFSAPYDAMMTLVTLLVAQSAATAGQNAVVERRSTAWRNQQLTLRRLVACAGVRPDLAAAGFLLRTAPPLFRAMYRHYARRSYRTA